MTIDQAIEILVFRSGDFFVEKTPDLTGAIKLGIEALKRVKAGRPAPPSLAYLPLDGEN